VIRLISKTDNKKLITFLNPYSYLLARNHKELFEKFDIKIDGMLLVKVLKLFGFKDIKRESFDMTSLAPLVFEDAIKNNESIYFIGTKPKVIDKAIENIKASYPKLTIVGSRDGYIKNEERYNLFEEIKALSPDIVVCGMGTPLQEQFLLDLQNSGWNGIGYTCGGFLHQTAGAIQYYPKWIDKYNLRWVYRIYDEPVLFKRYFGEYPKFFFYFLIDYVRYKKG
jgi:N-acetylglucosaminyldiphosphoundecaprenol N-acetyl-beta-D-mannosaminyltransferase